MVAWATGRRDETLAAEVGRSTRERTAGRRGVPWGSDGWEADAETVNAVSRDPQPTGRPGWERLVLAPGTRLTQVVKHRQGRRRVRAEVRAPLGEPAAQPFAVHGERLNGVLRDRLTCLTRKTHACAKTAATWDAAVSRALFAHTWLHPQRVLRQLLDPPGDGRRYHQRTPAMAIGLTNHVWTWHEFLTRPALQYQ